MFLVVLMVILKLAYMAGSHMAEAEAGGGFKAGMFILRDYKRDLVKAQRVLSDIDSSMPMRVFGKYSKHPVEDFWMKPNSNDYHQCIRFMHTMRAIQGSLIISSFIKMLIGFNRAWGEFTKLLSPLIVVPYVCLVGLGLFGRGFPQLATCVELGLPMLVFLVVFQQYLKHLHPAAHPILERLALLFCIGLVWAFAAILTAAGAYNNVREATKRSCRTDRSFLMTSAPWYTIPSFRIF